MNNEQNLDMYMKIQKDTINSFDKAYFEGLFFKENFNSSFRPQITEHSSFQMEHSSYHGNEVIIEVVPVV